MEFARTASNPGLMTPTDSVGVISFLGEGAMNKVWLVGIGGFLGSILRYGAGGLIGRLKAGWTFPLETLCINVAGCVVIGLLAGLDESRGVFSGSSRAFVFIGLLGGFTTFSTFGYETFQLMRVGQWSGALLSTTSQVALGLGGVWAGHALARVIWWSR
jgi:CrcB protein